MFFNAIVLLFNNSCHVNFNKMPFFAAYTYYIKRYIQDPLH
jgi:hypothetical protein